MWWLLTDRNLIDLFQSGIFVYFQGLYRVIVVLHNVQRFRQKFHILPEKFIHRPLNFFKCKVMLHTVNQQLEKGYSALIDV
ncbi:hypothetical protein Hdeb2414_s0018g00528561 [Helianthus debilis subsp. tardiflorus]